MKTLITRFYDARTNTLLREFREEEPSHDPKKIIKSLESVQADYEIFIDEETQDFTIQAKVGKCVIFYTTI